jgi:hypothetical protein
MMESPAPAGRENDMQVFRAKKNHERRIFRLYGKKADLRGPSRLCSDCAVLKPLEKSFSPLL